MKKKMKINMRPAEGTGTLPGIIKWREKGTNEWSEKPVNKKGYAKITVKAEPTTVFTILGQSPGYEDVYINRAVEDILSEYSLIMHIVGTVPSNHPA